MNQGRRKRRADIDDLTALHKLSKGDGGNGQDKREVTEDLENSLQRIANEIGINPIELYEKRRSEIVLTELGDAIADDASDFIQRAKNWRNIANTPRHGPHISIGIRAFHWNWIYQKVVSKIIKATEGRISLDVHTDSYKGLRRRMQRGRLDLCVLYGGLRTGHLEHYESTPLTLQSLYPFVHWHGSTPVGIRSLDYAMRNSDYGYLKIARDTRAFDDELKNKNCFTGGFFLRPKFMFTDGTLAWKFFKSDAGVGTIGYFSHRKSKLDSVTKHDHIRAYVEELYEIRRPLMAFRLINSKKNRVLKPTKNDADQVWSDIRHEKFTNFRGNNESRDRLINAVLFEITQAINDA